jgi:hypothetical protein
MSLEEYIRSVFVDGLSYEAAAQLCLHLFCTLDNIPEDVQAQCAKSSLTEVFSNLAKSGFLFPPFMDIKKYGMDVSDYTERRYWEAVIKLIFIKEDIIDNEVRRVLEDKIKESNSNLGHPGEGI